MGDLRGTNYDLGPTYSECLISYGGDMASTTFPPGPQVHGGTALGAGTDHPRHTLGSALRALRVFARAAVDVVVLGREGIR